MSRSKFLIALTLIALLLTGCSTARPRPGLGETPSPTSTPTPSTPVSSPPAADATPPRPLALVNATLIDGTGSRPLGDGVLVIQDGRIAALGPGDQVAIPPNAQVIDVAGRSVLPGFINAHVHRAFEAENLAAWARAGVTTVRDVGAGPGSPRTWDEWMAANSQAQAPQRPQIFDERDTRLNRPEFARIVAAGPILTVPGGYPIRSWGEEPALTVTSAQDAHERTARLLEAGADLVKISLERGPRLTKEEVAAIVRAAHERDTLVTAHVSAARHLALGVEAGIDEAAHMVTGRLPDKLIAQMVAQDVYLVPTLAVLEAYDSMGDSLENLERFVAAGGKVALGDDYGNPGIELGMPVRDMELMQEAGMTPTQIIVAATQHGARACNLEAELGTREAGKIADVPVVEGDPLQDIHALADAWLVIKDGVVIRSPPSVSATSP